MGIQRVAWKEAAWVFGLSRLMILVVTCIGINTFPQAGRSSSINCTVNANSCLLAWYHFDAIAYVNIAHSGYAHLPDTVYFPLWPLLEHFGGLLLGGSFPDSYYLAGLLLANICFYFALVLLYNLLVENFEVGSTRRALFYFAFSPYALFFFAGYTESIFVLLCLAFFLVLHRGKAIDWWLAGVLGFLGALTRSTGIVLAIPFLVIYIQRFWLPTERSLDSWGQRINALVPILLIPCGVITYMIYLYFTKGNALIFISQEATYGWHRHLSFPWVGIISSIEQAFFITPGIDLQNLLDLSFTLIPLAALVVGWRRIPLHYALFALGVIVFTLCFPQSSSPLTSLPRYTMILFPVALIFALWGKRERFHWVVMVFSIGLLALNIVLFTGHYWVA